MTHAFLTGCPIKNFCILGIMFITFLLTITTCFMCFSANIGICLIRANATLFLGEMPRLSALSYQFFQLMVERFVLTERLKREVHAVLPILVGVGGHVNLLLFRMCTAKFG